MEQQYPIPFEMLTHSNQVRPLGRILSPEPCVALDTESNSRHKYPESICLVQLATRGKAYLVDVLAVEDVGPIGEVLASVSVVKVIHAADYDIRCLDRQWGFRVINLYDTSIAARFIGMKKFSLPALVEELLGVRIAKDSRIQRSDWSRRPLTQEALNYAAADVWFLLDIYKVLQERLRDLGRDTWVSEECSRLEDIRYVAPDPETAFLSVKGSRYLSEQQLALLRRLYLFRESEALQHKLPPYYILPDEILVYLASNPTAALTSVPTLGKRASGRFGGLLQKALREGLTDPPVQSPRRNAAEPKPRTDIELLQRLKKWRIDEAGRMSIDPSLLWPMVSLERLARYPRTLDAELEAPEVRQWQRKVLGESISIVLTDYR